MRISQIRFAIYLRWEKMSEQFPILQYWRHKRDLRYFKPPFLTVPWELISDHTEQCFRNHSQSPETLARRGGLDPSEMLAIIHDEPYFKYRYATMTLEGAFIELGHIVTAAEK